LEQTTEKKKVNEKSPLESSSNQLGEKKWEGRVSRGVGKEVGGDE